MNGGTKHDQGKPRLSLIPTEAIFEMAMGLTYGADKYGTFNYRKGIEHSRLLDAALRHIYSHINGEDIDESGNTHLAHALASLSMLSWMVKNRADLDDRYRRECD